MISYNLYIAHMQVYIPHRLKSYQVDSPREWKRTASYRVPLLTEIANPINKAG